MQKSTVIKNKDFLYYNGSITNHQSSLVAPLDVFSNFFDQRTQSILSKADDYVMSVVRWTIPTNLIPLAIMQPLDFVPIPPFTTPNANPNLIKFAVGLTWFDGTNYIDFIEYLTYVPQNEFFPAPSLPQNLQNEFYWWIYSYQQILGMINVAYAAAFTRLKTMFPAAPPTLPPVVLYDSVTNLFTLYAQDSYQAPAINPAAPSSTDPNARFGSNTTITVWMNLNLADNIFFPGWDFDFAGVNNFSRPDPSTGFVMNKSHRIIIQNTTGLANTGFTSMVTEFPVISNILAFSNIILTSDTLPVNYESINPAQNQAVISSNSNVLQIISDYTYDVYSSTNAISGRLGIVYTPSVYRFTNLTSAEPLTRVSVQAQFLDTIGQAHPIFLRTDSTFNFKLMFVKKSKINELISKGLDPHNPQIWEGY